jgi:hypothetical protein
MIYLRSLSLYEQHERKLQINPILGRLGQRLMTHQQRYTLENDREYANAILKANKRAKERVQPHNVASHARVISVVGETSIRQPTFVVDEAEAWPSRKRVSVPTNETSAINRVHAGHLRDGSGALPPDHASALTCMLDMNALRWCCNVAPLRSLQLLTRFLASVSKFVVRQRVDERIAAVQAHTLHQQRNRLKQAESSLQRVHPLSYSTSADAESHLQRSYQLHAHNVQSGGITRGHDGRTRDTVELEAITKSNQLITFDEIVRSGTTPPSRMTGRRVCGGTPAERSIAHLHTLSYASRDRCISRCMCRFHSTRN